MTTEAQAKQEKPVLNYPSYELLEAIKPRPSVKQIKDMLANYYNVVSKGFDEFNTNDMRSKYLRMSESLVAGALRERGNIKKLLSIGAGTGAREIAIRNESKLDFAITCVDISPDMCESARKNGLEAVCGSFQDVDLPDNTFDAGMCLNAIEGLVGYEDRLAFFVKLHQVLKRGATFVVDVPDLNDRSGWGEAVKEQFRSENLAEQGYELGDFFYRRVDHDVISFAHYHSYDELSEIFKRSGFSIGRLIYINEQRGEITEPGDGTMFFFLVAE